MTESAARIAVDQANELYDQIAAKALAAAETGLKGDATRTKAFRQVRKGTDELRVATLKRAFDEIAEFATSLPESRGGKSKYFGLTYEVGFPNHAVQIARKLLQQPPAYQDADVIYLTQRTTDVRYVSRYNLPHIEDFVANIDDYLKCNDLTETLKVALACLIDRLGEQDIVSERTLVDKLESLLKPSSIAPLEPGETWSEAAGRALLPLRQPASQSNPKERMSGQAWRELFAQCEKAEGAMPAQAWSENTEQILDRIGEQEFTTRVAEWFPLVDRPRTKRIEEWSEYEPDPNLLITKRHGDILRGLAWCCSYYNTKAVSRALTALALTSYKKVPGVGPRLVRVGNACLWSLGRMGSENALAQLAILKARVKFRTAHKLIDKALYRVAERCGVTVEELEEMVVPTCGFTEVGIYREELGEHTALIEIIDTSNVELRFIKEDGKQLKSVPAAIKRDFADELKDLQATIKDLKPMLSAQRERMDQLYLQQRSWPFAVWRERYLDHPSIGTITRRLIWRFSNGGGKKAKTTNALFYEDRFVDANARVVDWPGNDNVRLWHPLDSETDEVVAWRNFIVEREIRQPFKQAFREIYLLTDAERATNAYSNRFASHILRQHQFNALCAVRGWRNQLRLMVDDEYPPAYRELPAFDVRAEYWVEGIGQNYETDVNESGVCHYLSTDQVRFYRTDASQRHAHAFGGGYGPRYGQSDSEPIPLTEVDPLVLSEIMRDVDLFVGVSSVGNDPTWSDGGPNGHYVDYWEEYSFGSVDEQQTQSRIEALKRIVPRLKIAGRCQLLDNYLVVRGELGTYKIHLRSGNVMMEPDEKYLCIVRAQYTSAEKKAGKIYLPFEGDHRLSLILSKAFLLADDKKITDKTILRQIKYKR